MESVSVLLCVDCFDSYREEDFRRKENFRFFVDKRNPVYFVPRLSCGVSFSLVRSSASAVLFEFSRHP